MKAITVPILLFFLGISINSFSVNNTEIEKKITSLLSKMTLEEKIGQLSHPTLEKQNDTLYKRIQNGQIGSFCVVNSNIFTPAERNKLQKQAVEKSRLGIPLLFAFDVIHGFSTIFPIPLGTSASWDLEMAGRASAIAAKEARSFGMDMAYSPMVDVSRDPRWGRISECFGEDVLLNAKFGEAVVKGYQGIDLTSKNTIGSCVKHFVGYGVSMGGRDKQFAEISKRALLETYLPSFEACVKAGAVSVMAAFSDISGVPATANHFTLTETLKEKWGFDGFTISDWNGVIELLNHGIAGNKKEAAEKSILAGNDVELRSDAYWKLLESVKEGSVDVKVINEAVRRVLRIKYRLGLFENPYVDETEALKVQLTPESSSLARLAAAESMVLLKNNGVLPLTENDRLISVVGSYANNKDVLGWWIGHGDQALAATAYEGINANKPSNTILINGTNPHHSAKITIVCVGEPGNTFGESHSLSDITLSKSQVEQVKEAKATGSKVIVVVFNGRPLALTPIMEYADAILLAWHSGTEAGNALADVLFGKINPCGKLTCSFPKSTGQIPIFYSDRISGRPQEDEYLDIDANPLFPFGFGLSYTKFEYNNVKLSTNKIDKNGSLEVSVDVTNKGLTDGKEVVQLYVHDKVASITRPQKELKNFSKILIKKGETKTVMFNLSAQELAFYDINYSKIIEPGEFDLWVGGNSVGLLHTTFWVK